MKRKSIGYHQKYEHFSGIKETPDKLCLTKAEAKRIDKWLDKHERKIYKKYGYT